MLNKFTTDYAISVQKYAAYSAFTARVYMERARLADSFYTRFDLEAETVLKQRHAAFIWIRQACVRGLFD